MGHPVQSCANSSSYPVLTLLYLDEREEASISHITDQPTVNAKRKRKKEYGANKNNKKIYTKNDETCVGVKGDYATMRAERTL
jgi:hypothetical protein